MNEESKLGRELNGGEELLGRELKPGEELRHKKMYAVTLVNGTEFLVDPRRGDELYDGATTLRIHVQDATIILPWASVFKIIQRYRPVLYVADDDGGMILAPWEDQPKTETERNPAPAPTSAARLVVPDGAYR
jgi:hypothetical protein